MNTIMNFLYSTGDLYSFNTVTLSIGTVVHELVDYSSHNVGLVHCLEHLS